MSLPDSGADPRSAHPKLLLTGFALAVLLSRLPLLGHGYGSDDDSWRNAVAGLRMQLLGHYVPSRPPGFPLFETITALLVPAGWVATNAAAIVAGTAAVVLFAMVARRLRVPGAGWLAIGFAFGPAMWVSTSQTMDYAYGIAFVLAAYLMLLEDRHALCGLFLGLATACRPSNGVLIVSVLAFLLAARVPPRVWLVLAGTFVLTTALCFLPVVTSQEIGDWRAQAAYHVGSAHVTPARLVPVLRAATVFCAGKTGLAVLVVALLASGITRALSRRHREARLRIRGPIVFEALSVALIGSAFLLIPYENAYLLPAWPFLLLLAARALSPRWVAIWSVALAIESVALPLLDVHRIVPGRLFLEMDQRRADMAETEKLAALRPAVPTVYVVGRFGVYRLLLLEPQLQRLPPAWAPFKSPGVALWTADHRVGFAASLSAADRDALYSRGYQVTEADSDSPGHQPQGSRTSREVAPLPAPSSLTK